MRLMKDSSISNEESRMVSVALIDGDFGPWTPCIVDCSTPASSLRGRPCTAVEENPLISTGQSSGARAEGQHLKVSGSVCGPGDLWAQ